MKAITLSEEGVIQKEEARLRNLVSDVLARAKTQGATAAEVVFAINQGFSVTARMGDVEQVEFNRDKSIDITVFMGKRSGSASTTDISDKALEDTVTAACHIAKYTDEDPYSGLADSEFLATQFPDLDMYHDWAITPQEAGEMAVKCGAAGMGADKRITNSDGVDVYTSQAVFAYGNSHGFIGGFPTTRHGVSCVLVAEDKEGDKERDYDYTCSRVAVDLTNYEEVGKRAAERTVARLEAQPIETQKAPIIFEAPIAASLLKCFLSAISGGSQYRKSSFLLDHLGKSVFPDHINITENPFVKRAFGSSSFDSDGVACSQKHFIKDGVLESYMLSTYSARKLGLKPTGNAGGVHNLEITHTNDSLSDLLKKMGTGFLVTELMGNGVSIVTGDYSHGASGFWVENGIIQYPVAGVSIAANLRDMFANIVCVGGDIDTRRNILSGSILLEEMTIAGV